LSKVRCEVAVERKAVASSASGDMYWKKNATMTDDEMDEKRSALWRPRFQMQIDLEGDRG
jgi:hypothetical protein